MWLRLQIGAGLALILALGLLALWFPMRQQALRDAASQHDLHVGFRLQTLAAQIEAQLSYGYALGEIDAIQGVLEAVQADDPSIRSIGVYAPDGVTLFSTDRALIGDRAEADFLAQLRAGPGMILQNNLGEEAGFIRLNSAGEVLPADLAQGLDRLFFIGLALVIGAGLFLGAGSLRGAGRRADAFVAGLEGRSGEAADEGRRVAAQILAAEDRLDQLSQQLAGADEERDDRRS
ncbi:hypothetical protein HOY34_06760 [Xinfangfangia sp. D13-10-4-6]|uniref:hypothetical protein n=1 Tax=Pseudogemmobacter hezensis TaxID=2737662 RepID=UPI001557E6B9|nr:hypothetical protein [Pseudogemmobacter hezensis]NPD14908.1 hypothetical protein [Pseudogemmobacter hezensis]